MNFTLIRKTTAFLIYAVALFLFVTPDILAVEQSSAEKKFSLQVRKKPLWILLEKISKESGYEIRLKTDSPDYPISIELNMVTIHEAIKRVFRDFDHIDIWDDQNKILTVVVFTTQMPPVSITGSKRSFQPATRTTR